MKSVITISRYWDKPEILTTLSTEGISLQTNLVDFIEALVQEIGSVTWVFTDKKFREKLDQAVIVVTEKIKEETIKVV